MAGLSDEAGFQARFRSALGQVNAGDLRAAAIECAALLLERPQEPALLQLRATIALRANDPEQAHAAAARSLQIRPAHVPTQILAARAAMALGLASEAVGLLQDAVSVSNGGSADAAFLLCHACLACGHAALGAAIAQAAARYPMRAQDWQEIGLALQRAGLPDQALAALDRAAEADPSLAGAQFGRGLLLREAGRTAAALAALSEAVRLQPSASSAWFALGLTHQDCGDEAAAAAAYEQALALRPDFAEAAVNLGIARQALGDMTAAMASYRRAYAIRPDALARIAQAVSTARTGTLWLDPDGLRRALAG